jgi:hypothetical protein
MSLPQDAQPAKLVISLLMNDKSSLLEVAHEMMSAFGAIDMVSGWMDFDYTDYYAREMGGPLYRRMLVFKTLIAQAALPDIKLTTNALEDRHAEDGRRSVNIDPGYLLLERFVLATGKNYTHRIFIGSGIYADLTLIFQQGDFQTLPWTYPDYGDDQMRSFLKLARRKYAADLRLRHRAE